MKFTICVQHVDIEKLQEAANCFDIKIESVERGTKTTGHYNSPKTEYHENSFVTCFCSDASEIFEMGKMFEHIKTATALV